MQVIHWKSSLIGGLLVSLAFGGIAEAGRVTSEKIGWSVEIPADWKHKMDPSGTTLLMGAPSGFRIRLQVEDGAPELSRTRIKAHYKKDGKALLARFGKVKVLERPTRKGWLGKEKSYGYTFVYRDTDASIQEVRTFLADGSSKKPGAHLEVKFRAYGERSTVAAHAEELEEILASFRFPSAEVPEVEEAPVATAPVLALVDLPPPPVPEVGGLDAGTPRTRAPSVTSFTGSAPRGHNENARAYDRGSLSGGVGFMREARVSTNAEHNRVFLAAFGIKDRGTRSEEEKKKAAAYLGFNLNN